jgi:acyl dehydratase
MSATFDALEADGRFELTTEPVTTQQLVQYAGASDDYNRIHYDLPYAVEAGLGGLIAHGLLTMAFLGRAVTDWAGPACRIKRIAARFNAPVRVGDTVHVTGTLIAGNRAGGRGELHCELQAEVAGRIVATGDVVVLTPPA